MPYKPTICAADQAQDGDRMAHLLEDLEALAEHHNPHRDGVLQLVLECWIAWCPGGCPQNPRNWSLGSPRSTSS
jgi:hypothetical protein